MDEKIMIAASELVETVEKYLKQEVSRSILCLKLAALKEAFQQEQPEVDLAEEITRFFSKNPIPAEHLTDWPLLKNTAIFFFDLGKNA